MERDELRALQAPLKEHYRVEPGLYQTLASGPALTTALARAEDNQPS